jgi:hypothetical protein
VKLSPLFAGALSVTIIVRYVSSPFGSSGPKGG